MIRVFLADDHAVLRHGLKLMMEATHELTVIGSAGDGYTALNSPEIDQCDVLILDLSLPRISGSEVMRQMRARRPDLPIVILSMYPEDQYAVHLIRDGASAYLSKDRPPEELLQAIRKVVRGGTYLTDQVAQQAMRGRSEPMDAPHQRLSQREQEIFRLVAAGRTVSDIAAELDLHISTVSNHLRHVKEKLNARTLADLIDYANRLGLRG